MEPLPCVHRRDVPFVGGPPAFVVPMELAMRTACVGDLEETTFITVDAALRTRVSTRRRSVLEWANVPPLAGHSGH